MKIKIKKLPYSEVKALPFPKKQKPKKPLFVLKTLMKILSASDLKQVNFKANYKNIDSFPSEPCLIIGNHSSFIDLEMVVSMLYPKSVSIICTSDAFIGKSALMRRLGCIPVNKFVTDPSIIRDMSYALKKNKTHLLMYPEASYSFDGCATPLPEKLSSVFKLLKVPVVMITTHGAFLRDPLYNCLQKRSVSVDASVELLFSKEDLKTLSAEESEERIKRAFSFDNFAYQQENKIRVDEPFRADGLERILYKCPHCHTECSLSAKGTVIKCNTCGVEYELTEYGHLKALNANSIFTHIPDWYKWEREEVRREVEGGSYRLEFDCGIHVQHDFKALYDIGEGHLLHDLNGFHLISNDKELDFHRSPTDNYGLYSDYYWYEVGDTVCIGNKEELYYCFPKEKVSVAKARLAAEEMYRFIKGK